MFSLFMSRDFFFYATTSATKCQLFSSFVLLSNKLALPLSVATDNGSLTIRAEKHAQTNQHGSYLGMGRNAI
jgi:hypothetical protein